MDAGISVRLATVRDRPRFDGVTILFHWTTAVVVVAQFALGYGMSFVSGRDALDQLLLVHRFVGVSVFLLAILRLAWRGRFAHLPPFPPHMPKLQQWAVKANEYALYLLLILQPLTGLGDTLFRARSFVLLAWTIPPFFPRVPAIYKTCHLLHELGAEAFAGFIGLHAAAALIHVLVLKDRVLHRMLPGRDR